MLVPNALNDTPYAGLAQAALLNAYVQVFFFQAADTTIIDYRCTDEKRIVEVRGNIGWVLTQFLEYTKHLLEERTVTPGVSFENIFLQWPFEILNFYPWL